eukprot:2150406-Pleurochrysis_carterae.AAC.1
MACMEKLRQLAFMGSRLYKPPREPRANAVGAGASCNCKAPHAGRPVRGLGAVFQSCGRES